MSDLMDALKSLDEDLEDYVRAERYYEGDPEEFFVSMRVRRALEAASERFRINMARTPVDAVAARCRVTSVVVTDDEAATNAIQEVWDANGLDLHANNWTRRALEYGDAYVIAWPPPEVDDALDDDDPDAEELDADGEQDEEALAAGVELTYVAPTMGRMIYDVERPARKIMFVMRWKDGQRTRANLFYPDRVEKWITREGAKGNTQEEWVSFSEPVPNPYGQIPVFHFRTDAPYGVPEHLNAYPLQDAINKLFITHMGSVESQGAPQRYGLLDPAAVLGEGQDDPDWDDDADAPTDTGSALASSSLRGGPGTMQFLAGLKAVGEWGTADPEKLLGPMAVYIRIMAHVTDTPVHHFDLERGDQPSGSALQKKDAPFNDKVKDRQRWFQATHRDLWRFVLKLKGITLDRAKVVDVRWSPPGVASDTETWTVVDLKRQAGVPARQLLLEAGYQPDDVEEWLDEAGEDMALAQRVNVLVAIGDAVQKIGTGIGFGILTKENASEIIQAVIGQVVPEVKLEVPEEPDPVPLMLPPGADPADPGAPPDDRQLPPKPRKAVPAVPAAPGGAR